MASSPAIFLRKLSLTSSGGGGGTTTTVTKTVKFIKYLLHYPSHINLSRNIAKVTSFKEGDVFLYSELVPTNDILDLNYTLDVINKLVSTNILSIISFPVSEQITVPGGTGSSSGNITTLNPTISPGASNFWTDILDASSMLFRRDDHVLFSYVVPDIFRIYSYTISTNTVDMIYSDTGNYNWVSPIVVDSLNNLWFFTNRINPSILHKITNFGSGVHTTVPLSIMTSFDAHCLKIDTTDNLYTMAGIEGDFYMWSIAQDGTMATIFHTSDADYPIIDLLDNEHSKFICYTVNDNIIQKAITDGTTTATNNYSADTETLYGNHITGGMAGSISDSFMLIGWQPLGGDQTPPIGGTLINYMNPSDPVISIATSEHNTDIPTDGDISGTATITFLDSIAENFGANNDLYFLDYVNGVEG